EKIGSSKTLPGDVAFRLYDTYGFPYDLTEDALRARGIGVDRAGFDAAMARQKAAARAAWKGSGQAADGEVWFDIAERAEAGTEVAVLVIQTLFYGESGGLRGDTGTISTEAGLSIAVSDTAKPL